MSLRLHGRLQYNLGQSECSISSETRQLASVGTHALHARRCWIVVSVVLCGSAAGADTTLAAPVPRFWNIVKYVFAANTIRKRKMAVMLLQTRNAHLGNSRIVTSSEGEREERERESLGVERYGRLVILSGISRYFHFNKYWLPSPAFTLLCQGTL